MLGMKRQGLARLALVLVTATSSVSASRPQVIAPASGGMWQISRSARAAPEQSLCLADPIMLGQYEHRGGRCSRVILSNVGNRTVISYTCTDGGFGRSEITLLTPRTMRVATQGISGGGPFNYVLHARRTGACPLR